MTLDFYTWPTATLIRQITPHRVLNTGRTGVELLQAALAADHPSTRIVEMLHEGMAAERIDAVSGYRRGRAAYLQETYQELMEEYGVVPFNNLELEELIQDGGIPLPNSRPDQLY